MAYEFKLGTSQYIDYGTRTQFILTQSASLGLWVNFPSSVGPPDDDRLAGVSASLPPFICVAQRDGVHGNNGYGVLAEHIKGGGAAFGVKCIPGNVDARFKLGLDQWMYFGFSRNYFNRTYYSYFGTRTALLDGPTFTYVIAQDPIFDLGPFFVGMSFDARVGPFSYWDTDLTREQHLALARCTLPTGVDLSHLLIWSKMREGAADASPNAWPNTFHNSPVYVADEGCASFGTGQDYRLYNT